MPDEVLARDVGGKQRCADGEPSDAVTGEEVFVRCAPAARMMDPDAEDSGKAGDDDQVIERDGVRGLRAPTGELDYGESGARQPPQF